MIKSIKYNIEARESLKRGIDALADAVSVTLGPKGRTVIIEREGTSPMITKDGVSVAKEIYLKDSVENIGAQMLKEVSLNTNEQAGDGTTTATVLAQSILNLGFKQIREGKEPIDIKRELDSDLPYILEQLDKHKISIKNNKKRVYDIANVSTNGDKELSTLIGNIVKKTNDPNVILEISPTRNNYIEHVEGLSFNSSFIDNMFVENNIERTTVLKNSYVLIVDGKLGQSKDLLSIMDQVISVNRSLTIITEQANQDHILTLLRNKQKGLNSIIINSPGFGPGRQELLDDIAIYTGGEIVSPASIKNLKLSQLGYVGGLLVTEDKTIITEGHGTKEDIDNRIADLEQFKKNKDKLTQENIQKRISKFKGGIGILYLGANTELEYKEKYDRAEDAVNAVKAALDEGIISGGGTTLFKISEESGKDTLLMRAIKEPYNKIKFNSGETSGDYQTEYKSYLKSGIVDPKKVTRVALENAVSVAGTILTTEAVITNE